MKQIGMSKGEKDIRCVCGELSMYVYGVCRPCRGYVEEGAKPKDSRVHPSIGAPRGRVVV